MSKTLSWAVLLAFPGGVPAVYWIPNMQVPPAATETVCVLSKLQLICGDTTVGATKAKLAAFVPVIVALVIFNAFVVPGF